MDKKKELFETMPVPKALVQMAIPTIIGQLITMIYNLADTFYIGQTNNPFMVAASTVAFVLFFMQGALSNLFGVGGGSLISRLLGQNRHDEAKRVSAFSLYGTVVLTVLYSSACLIFMDPLLRLLGASNDTIGYCRQYTLWVTVVGGLPTCLSMVMGHLLRSEGYAKQASFGLGLGGVMNILLDPLFMFVVFKPGQEVQGAAVATLLSNCISFVYFACISYRLRHKTSFCLTFKNGLPEKKSILSVFSVGLPSSIGSLLSSISNSVINNLTSGYNDFALAAMGIVKKVDMLPMNVGMGLCQAMVPLVAYNYSARNYKRMNAFANAAKFAGMVFAGICIVVFEIFAPQIITLFIEESQTVAYGTDFLRIAVLATPLMIFNFLMSYTFQAMGQGGQSLLLTSCRQGLVNIPLLFTMNAVFKLYGVIWTQLLADGITIFLSVILYVRLLRRLKREQLQG